MKTARALSLSGATSKPLSFQRFRRFVKHAWILHGYLIATMITMPFASSSRADGGALEYSRSESSLEVSVTPDNGGRLYSGDQTTLTATVVRHSWEIWTDPATNDEFVQNGQDEVVTGMPLEFFLDSGSGGFDSSTTSTDTNGEGVATFTMGTSSSSVRVVATDSSNSASAEAYVTIEFANQDQGPPADEEWYWERSESCTTAALSSIATTEGLSAGDCRDVWIHATSASWDVEFSNYGNQRTTNYMDSPASYGQVNWVVESGDGTLSTMTSAIDGAGDAMVSFTMGSTDSVLRADFSYAGGDSANASITFTAVGGAEPDTDPDPSTGDSQPDPLMEWAFSRTENSYRIWELHSDDSTEDVQPGDQFTVTGTLLVESYAVYANGYGEERWDYDSSSSSPQGTQVFLTIGYGANHLSTPTPVTDANGQFAVEVTVGSGSATLEANPYEFCTSADSSDACVSFHAAEDQWTLTDSFTRRELFLFPEASVAPRLPGSTVNVWAVVWCSDYEVYTDDQGIPEDKYVGGYIDPYPSVQAVSNSPEPVPYFEADEFGWMQIPVTLGFQDVELTGWVSTGSNYDAPEALTKTIHLAPTPEVYAHVKDEATVWITMQAPEGDTNFTEWQTRNVQINASYEAWSLWTSNWNRQQLRPISSGPAVGAGISYVINNGNGELPLTGGGTTDIDGAVTISVSGAENDTNINATVSFGGGEANSSYTLYNGSGPTNPGEPPGPQWVKTGLDGALSVSLSDNPSTGTVTADAIYTSWEIWTRGSETEPRNEHSGPAINADVSFTFDSGTGSINPANGVTNFSGTFTGDYTVTESGTILAQVTFAGQSATATVNVTHQDPPPTDPPGSGDPPPPTDPPPVNPNSPSPDGNGTGGDDSSSDDCPLQTSYSIPVSIKLFNWSDALTRIKEKNGDSWEDAAMSRIQLADGEYTITCDVNVTADGPQIPHGMRGDGQPGGKTSGTLGLISYAADASIAGNPKIDTYIHGSPKKKVLSEDKHGQHILWEFTVKAVATISMKIDMDAGFEWGWTTKKGNDTKTTSFGAKTAGSHEFHFSVESEQTIQVLICIPKTNP